MKWVQITDTCYINLEQISEIVVGRNGVRLKRGMDGIEVKKEYEDGLLVAANIKRPNSDSKNIASKEV